MSNFYYRSLEDLTDFSVTQDYDLVTTGVLGLNLTGFGHKVAGDNLIDLILNHHIKYHGHIESERMTRILKRLCNVKNVSFTTLTKSRENNSQ